MCLSVWSRLRSDFLDPAVFSSTAGYNTHLGDYETHPRWEVLPTLRRANLEEASLRVADLSGARSDDHTTWPEGFDPVAAGVIFD